MTLTLTQIFGGVVGLAIAWLMNYYFEMRSSKAEEQARIQHKLELEQYKLSLKKTVK